MLSVIVSIGVTMWGRIMTFINAAVKINGTYYHDMFLTQQLLPAMHEICAVFFTFQQCNAGTTDTSRAFISPHLWHPTTQI